MSVGYVAVGVMAASSLYGASQQRKAASEGSDAQIQAADKSIAESGRQFDAMKELMAPYVEGGERSLTLQQDFLGLSGPEAEQQAIQGIEQGPQFGAMMEQGENAILQNASATGGLRGGNTQGALAQFRPQILSDLINQRFSQLGGITSMGENAAAMQGNAGMQTGQDIGDQYTQQGAAIAGGAMGRRKANVDFANTIGNTAGFIMGKKF